MAKPRKNSLRPPWIDPKLQLRQKMVRFFIHLFAWVGIAMLYYIGFSLFFDTPVEHQMKRSTAKLRQQYEVLNRRYDSVEKVLVNVVERDRNVFRTLFEAEPYQFDTEAEANKWVSYEKFLTKSNNQLGAELSEKSRRLEKAMRMMQESGDEIYTKFESLGEKVNYIPSIQPVVNKDLTLLTASYGLRIHPFYKTLTPHMGVDYTVPEGSRIFATADGRVKNIISKSTSSGLTVVLSHGNGEFETTYSHLSKINVSSNQLVRRGDIIALSGNTGLSLAPHLHYEVKHNQLRVDPIHYFFMELTPQDYRKLMEIARSGMQSFD